MPDLEKVDVPNVPASQLGRKLVLLAVAGKEAGEGARAVLEREGQLHRVGILGPVRGAERRDHPEQEAPDTQDVAVGHLGHGARGKRRELAFDLVGQGAGDALPEQDLSPGKYGTKRGEASVVVIAKVRDQDGVEVERQGRRRAAAQASAGGGARPPPGQAQQASRPQAGGRWAWATQREGPQTKER